MGDAWIRNLRDVGDVLRHARNPAELVKALTPNRWLERKVLNEGEAGGPGGPPTRIAEALRSLGNRLKVEAIDENGHVDYRRLRSSPAFEELRRTSGLLRGVDLESMSEDDARIAFWINVYNVLAVHGVIALDIRKSVMEVPSFFRVVAYRVGGFVLSLDEIENGVLRRNAPHPVTRSRLFGDDDPRLGLCPSHTDPRIHAALVCASTSCPPVAFYEAEKLDAQLELATLNYVASDVVVDDQAKVVRVPRIFGYYERDFGRLAGVRIFLVEHARGAQRQSLQAAFEADYELDYHRYDWSLNSIA